MNTDSENFKGHTPGPLVAIVGDHPQLCQPGKGRVLFPHVEIPHECAECAPRKMIVHAGSDDWPNGCDANARLYAAAPDLLRERNELRPEIESMNDAIQAIANGEPNALNNALRISAQAREVLARCGK